MTVSEQARTRAILALALVLMIVIMTAGCATFHAPASPEESLALNYASIESLAQSTANSLRVGTIDAKKARNISEVLEQAYQVNKMAEAALEAGQIADSQTYLQTTSQILTQVEVLLQ